MSHLGGVGGEPVHYGQRERLTVPRCFDRTQQPGHAPVAGPAQHAVEFDVRIDPLFAADPAKTLSMAARPKITLVLFVRR